MSTILASVNAFYRATSEELGIDLRIAIDSVVPALVATYTAGYWVGERFYALRDRYLNN